MEIFSDIVQGSPEWFELRRGLPTASMFSKLMASGDQRGRTTYLYQLAGERLTGIPMEKYTNEDMEHGKEIEPQLREDYAFLRNCEPMLVGFVRNGKCGASPDALIGEEGALEIKRAKPHILIPLRRRFMKQADFFPTEHYAQCQGVIMVSESKWCDLLVGYPKMKPMIVRTMRDEQYIERLRDAIDVFDLELRRLVEEMK